MHKLLLVLFLFCSATGLAQNTDTLIKKLDSMHKHEEKPGNKPEIDVNKNDYTYQTNITPKAYFVLLGTDLVQEVTGPFHAPKKTWIKVGEFAVIEAALVAFADRPVQRTATQFMTDHPGAKNTSQYITNFGGAWEGYTLAAFAAYGIIFKSNKVKTTTLLATQSYLAAGAMESLNKFLTGRQRPYGVDESQPNANLIFRGPSSNSLVSSFPSGHTTAAFSAATVFAQEYKDQTLIPVVAYTAATLVGISRITQNAHWISDVFAGAALGYVTGKQVVYNYHRYARLQAGKEKKMSFIFNLQYNDGIIMPGMVCRF
jgi:membrane-associated phospholipid phosphatase